MFIHNYSFGHDVVINSAISAPAGLTKAGVQQLTLGGNTAGIGGPVNVNQGGIRFTSPASLSALATINFNESHAAAIQDLTVEFGDGVSASASTAIRLNASTTEITNISPIHACP